jgi:hypothetical protein
MPFPLLNITNKIFTIVLHKRITNVLEPHIADINTLLIIIEQLIEYNSPLYLLLVDFTQAFDIIQHARMWEI